MISQLFTLSTPHQRSATLFPPMFLQTPELFALYSVERKYQCRKKEVKKSLPGERTTALVVQRLGHCKTYSTYIESKTTVKKNGNCAKKTVVR
jgi:hypothetical protein